MARPGPHSALEATAVKVRLMAKGKTAPFVVRLSWWQRRKFTGYDYSLEELKSDLQYYLQNDAKVVVVGAYSENWTDSPRTWPRIEFTIEPIKASVPVNS